MEIYERLSKGKTTAPDDVLMRMGRAAKAAGRGEKATEAFSRVVYEFPFSDLAIAATSRPGQLAGLPVSDLIPAVSDQGQDDDQPVEELDVESAQASADNSRLDERDD